MGDAQLDGKGVVATCPSCGQRNRLSYGHLAAGVRCGKCQTPLAAPDAPIEASSTAEFDAAISQSALPVVVDFWAPWCGPCRMVAPELARVAAANRGKYLVLKVNTDALPELGDRFGIRSIPTMAVFAGGLETARTSGARPAAEIESFIHAAVSHHAQ